MGRVEWLLRQHQKLIDDGFQPVDVAVQSEDEKLFVEQVDCSICKCPDIKGIIIWQNEMGETRYTGFTCYERVVDRLNLTEEKKKDLLWVARHRKIFEGRKVSLDEAEYERLLSYERPLSSAYGNRWKPIAKEIWANRDRFQMSEFERSLVETLVSQSGKFWSRRSPTAKQRRFLNLILVKFIKWRRMAGLKPLALS